MLSHGSTLTHRKKFATLSGGCAPEASTLPPVTVSRIFYFNSITLDKSLSPMQIFFQEQLNVHMTTRQVKPSLVEEPSHQAENPLSLDTSSWYTQELPVI